MTRDELRALLPWPRPSSAFENDGAVADIAIDGHAFQVRDSGGFGIHSGRTLWRVECTTCGEVCHEGSTSATTQIAMHLDRVAT